MREYEVNGTKLTLPHSICSVYTMEDGNAVALIDELRLNVQVGGTGSEVGIVKIDGVTYLAANGWSCANLEWFGGTWYVYTVDGAECELIIEAKYSYTDINYVGTPEQEATINSEKVDFSVFKTFENSITRIKMLNESGTDSVGVPLESLLNQCS